MRYWFFIISTFFAKVAIADPYAKNALYLSYAHTYKIQTILKLIEKKYGHESDYKWVQNEMDEINKLMGHVFIEKDYKKPKLQKLDLKEKKLAKICSYALEQEVSYLKNAEFLKENTDDHRIRYILTRLENNGRDKYLPLLRVCEVSR